MSSDTRETDIPDVVIADYGALMIALKSIIDMLEPKRKRAAFKILDVALQLSSSEIINYRGKKDG